MEMVCLATGTKFISDDNLNFQGKALIDCHAEILAKRCFRQFLIMQVKETITRENLTVLKKKL